VRRVVPPFFKTTNCFRWKASGLPFFAFFLCRWSIDSLPSFPLFFLTFPRDFFFSRYLFLVIFFFSDVFFRCLFFRLFSDSFRSRFGTLSICIDGQVSPLCQRETASPFPLYSSFISFLVYFLSYVVPFLLGDLRAFLGRFFFLRDFFLSVPCLAFGEFSFLSVFLNYLSVCSLPSRLRKFRRGLRGCWVFSWSDGFGRSE